MLQIKDMFWCVVKNNNSGKFYEQYFQVVLQNIKTLQKIHYDIGRRYYHLSPTKYNIKHLIFWISGIDWKCAYKLEEINWENTNGKDKYIFITGLASGISFSGIMSKKHTRISFISEEILKKIEYEILGLPNETLSCKILLNLHVGSKFSHSKEQFIKSYIKPINNLIKV